MLPTPTEWIVILAAVVMLLLWGPSKIPQLARSIGEAVREFRKAVRGEESEENRNK